MIMQQKYLFIDRDGTLIAEPADRQVNSIEKLELMPGVISALSQFRKMNYQLIMVSNQDGLGTKRFPFEHFQVVQQLMLRIFQSQGIVFDDVRICPHLQEDHCSCRKPKVGLLLDYLKEQMIDREHSFMIGDRETDMQLASNLGITGLMIGAKPTKTWEDILQTIIAKPRQASINRKTNETKILIKINLDHSGHIAIDTGIGFFNHMLEQLIKHAGISASILAEGDLINDDHHTVEDTALTLGAAIKQALGDKHGIARYGFVLPMDEALATIALDLSGRPYCQFNGKFNREKIGDLSTELIPHFFRSLADSMSATLHITLLGNNDHHIAESAFKGMGQTLRQAIAKQSTELPTTKGVL